MLRAEARRVGRNGSAFRVAATTALLKAEADSLYRRGIALARTLPELQRSLFLSLASYGGSLRSWGRLDEAERVLEEALISAERTVGPEHPLSLTIASDLGRVEAERGRSEEESRRTSMALAALESQMPIEAPPRLSAASNHGHALLLSNRPAEALAVLEPASRAARSALPEGHPRTRGLEADVAKAREQLGRGGAAG